MLRGRALAVLVMLGALALPATAAAHPQRPPVVPSVGPLYDALSVAWWQYTLAQPAATNPLLDTTGANCALGQSGRVFFLVGTTGGKATRDQCSVRAGKFLFFPLVNAFDVHTPGDGLDDPDVLWDDFTSPEHLGFGVDSLRASVDGVAVREAVGTLADELGLSVEDCAAGIVRVANAEMVRAMRVMTVERGVDPREFALLAFGGAGPLHAAAIAEELGMRKILVPRASGVLSALGLAAADRRRDHARTVFLHGDDLTAEELAVEDGDAAYDVRYRGQSFELTVPVEADIVGAFHRAHEERYGYADPAREIELVAVRTADVEAGPAVAPELGAPASVRGPELVELDGATCWVPDGWRGETDATGTLVLTR